MFLLMQIFALIIIGGKIERKANSLASNKLPPIFAASIYISLGAILLWGLFYGQFWQSIFIATMSLGVWLTLFLALPSLWYVPASTIVIAARLIFPNIFVENLFLLLASIGFAVSFALAFPRRAVVVFLILAAFVDVILVTVAGVTPKIIIHLAEHQVIPAIAAPQDIQNFFDSSAAQSSAQKNSVPLVLHGLGDLILPLIFVVSSWKKSRFQAIGAAACGSVGIIAIYCAFAFFRDAHTLPAIPFLIGAAFAGAFIGWILERLFKRKK